MGEITISQGWAWLVGICAAIVSISKAIEILRKAFGKKETSEKIAAATKRIELLEDRLNKIDTGLLGYERSNGIMFRAMLNLLEHVRTGNAVDKLLDSENELQKFLTNR